MPIDDPTGRDKRRRVAPTMIFLSLLLMLVPLAIAAIRRAIADAAVFAGAPRAVYEMFTHERFGVTPSVVRLRYVLLALVVAGVIEAHAVEHANKATVAADQHDLTIAMIAIWIFWTLPLALYVARAIRWGAFAAEPLKFASVPVRVSWALAPALLATLSIEPLRSFALRHDPVLAGHAHLALLPPGVVGVAEVAVPIAIAIFATAALVIRAIEGVTLRSLVQRTPYRKGSVDHLMDDFMRDFREGNEPEPWHERRGSFSSKGAKVE